MLNAPKGSPDAYGIFAIMCPRCGTPYELPHEALQRMDDVNICSACGGAFVMRFGYVLADPTPVDRGAA